MSVVREIDGKLRVDSIDFFGELLVFQQGVGEGVCHTIERWVEIVRADGKGKDRRKFAGESIRNSPVFVNEVEEVMAARKSLGSLKKHVLCKVSETWHILGIGCRAYSHTYRCCGFVAFRIGDEEDLQSIGKLDVPILSMIMSWLSNCKENQTTGHKQAREKTKRMRGLSVWGTASREAV